MKQFEGTVRVSSQDEHTLITLQGPLDHELAGQLIPLASKVRPPVVFDLKQVPYITSAGSRIMLGYYQNFGMLKPTVRHANQAVLQLLRLSGALEYVNLAEDELMKTSGQ